MGTQMETTVPTTDYDAQLNQAWEAMHKIEQEFEHLVGRPFMRGRGGALRGRGVRRRPMGSFVGMRSRFAEINDSLRREQSDMGPRNGSFGFNRGFNRSFEGPGVRDRPLEYGVSEMGPHDGMRRMNFGRSEIRERRDFGSSDFDHGFRSRGFGRDRMDEGRSQFDFGYRKVEPVHDVPGNFRSRYENRWPDVRDIKGEDPPLMRGKRRYEHDGTRYGPPTPEPRRRYDDSEWVEKQPPRYDDYEEQSAIRRNSLYRRENAPSMRYIERRENTRYAEPPTRRRRLEENHAPKPAEISNEETPRKIPRRTSRHSPITFNREELKRERSPVAAEVQKKPPPPPVRRVTAEKPSFDSNMAAQRNKKMFNALLSTLQTFDNEKPEGYVAQEKKIKEVAERLELEHEETVKKIMDEKKKILELRRQQRLEIKRLTRKRGIAVSCQAEIDHMKRLQNFVMTSSKPHIYYLPLKHSIRTMELHKKTQKQLDESINAVTEEMENRIKSVDEQIHFEPEEGDEHAHESGGEDNQTAEEAEEEEEEDEEAAAAVSGEPSQTDADMPEESSSMNDPLQTAKIEQSADGSTELTGSYDEVKEEVVEAQEDATVDHEDASTKMDESIQYDD